jgi:hypothetical protein
MRRALFWAFVAICIAGAATVVVIRRDRASGTSTEPQRESSTPARLDDIRTRPHVYYRSTRSDEFGRVVVADLDAPDQRRVVTPLQCDRVDFGTSRGICLVRQPDSVSTPAVAQIYDASFSLLGTVPLAGFPIRTRLSPDERVAAATVFVTGERYDSDFTTRTTLIDTQTLAVLGDLEQFETERDGAPFSRVDFNFWGVTFARDRSFFATLGFSGARLLVKGDLGSRHLRVIRDTVECPSLSPDGRTIAFKSPLPGSREWRPHVLDVESGREWAIRGETRNIDDQMEWLDGGHVLYQYLEPIGVPGEAMNVWVSPVQPEATEAPAVFIHGAMSPAVVHP